MFYLKGKHEKETENNHIWTEKPNQIKKLLLDLQWGKYSEELYHLLLSISVIQAK